MTATNGSPSSRAKYASDTAVEPLEASTIVGLGADPAVAEAVQEQRAREPVLQGAGGVDRLVLEVEIDAPALRQREDVQVRVGRAVGVGVDAPDGLVDPASLGG